MAEVTGVAPLSRFPFEVSINRGTSTGTRQQWWVSLCGGRSLVRSTPDIPWGNAQLEN